MATPTTKHAQILQHVRQRIGIQRRRAATTSLLHFAQLYCRHHLSKPLSSMHREIYELLAAQMNVSGSRIALAAPRGSAKSTLVTLIYLLWVICHQRKRFIVLASDTADKAIEFLGHLKHELTENELLQHDYPEVCEDCASRGRAGRWRQNEIVTRNKVRVLALGCGQNIRGRRMGAIRPDLILLDDVEFADNTQTAEARQKIEDWFQRSILKAGGSGTQVIVVGTIQHYASLLARLTTVEKSPTWETRLYRSVISWSQAPEFWERWANILNHRDEHEGARGKAAADQYFKRHQNTMLDGTKVLWPENESYYDLMVMRETEGRAAFDAEKQNEPVDPQDCLFAEEDIHFWDDQYEDTESLLKAIEGHVAMVGACDPSLGKRGKRADDSVIVTLAKDRSTGIMYVIDADIARRKPDKTLEDILAYARLRPYRLFGFETNQFQEFMASELRKRAMQSEINLSVFEIKQTGDKLGRIQRLQPLIKAGHLRLSRRHHQLLEQLRHFPKAAHDDGPDALEMAVHTAERLVLRKCSSPVILTRPFRKLG